VASEMRKLSFDSPCLPVQAAASSWSICSQARLDAGEQWPLAEGRGAIREQEEGNSITVKLVTVYSN